MLSFASRSDWAGVRSQTRRVFLQISDQILLVITGEFGRTPRINQNGGRDHWGNLCTPAFAGGGLKMGQVIGRSDRTGSEPASNPISSQQVLATLMHVLFDLGELARVTKNWAGIGKELFTSADNYVLEISDDIPADHPSRELIVAAVLCIDKVLKEK